MSESSEYDRGVIAGAIENRLADHDRHFRTINGSIEKVGTELHELKLAVQRLGDQAIARDATVITTASALKDADEARRNTADQRWSPWQKGFAVIAAVAALVGMYFVLRGLG
jgi:hypothetical protein